MTALLHYIAILPFCLPRHLKYKYKASVFAIFCQVHPPPNKFSNATFLKWSYHLDFYRCTLLARFVLECFHYPIKVNAKDWEGTVETDTVVSCPK